MIMIATLTNMNISRNYFISYGKIMENKVVGLLMKQGIIMRNVHKDIYKSIVMNYVVLR